MRNTETVSKAAVEGKAFKAGALSSDAKGNIYSYRERIATRTGFTTWNVQPAGLHSTTTSKHCNGVANELHKRGFKITRVDPGNP